MSEPRKTGAAYIRVSTEDQLDYSPESQIKAIREYAERHNIIIPDKFVYTDEGISGRKAAKRPSFQKMISAAKQTPSPFQIILVWKFSRFARNREDSIIYKSMLRKQCGIEVVSVAEPLSDDKTSILIEALLEAMDEYYSINLGEEVKRGMTEKASRGEPLSVPAYGYDIVNKEYVINSDEAKIVKYIFEKYASGDGIRKIVSVCNDIGVRTHRGNLFEQRTIEYILQNPVYIGKIRWNPVHKTGRNFDDPDILIIDGIHEPIIEHSLWNEVQQLICRNRQLHQKHTKPFASKNIMQGLIRCSACGSTLIKCGEYLQCQRYTKGMCKVSHCISYKKCVNAIISHIVSVFDLGKIKNLTKVKSKVNQNDIILSRISREEKKLIRVKEAYLAGVDSVEEYKASKENIMKNICDLKSMLGQDDSCSTESKNYNPVIKNIADILTENNDDNIYLKNVILKAFVNRIVFDKEAGELIFYYYV